MIQETRALLEFRNEWVSSFGQEDFNQKKDFLSEQSENLFTKLNENANELAHVKSQLRAVETELKELDKASFLQNSKTLSKKMGMANTADR